MLISSISYYYDNDSDSSSIEEDLLDLETILLLYQLSSLNQNEELSSESEEFSSESGELSDRNGEVDENYVTEENQMVMHTVNVWKFELL